MDIGKKIESERKQQQLSREELAEAIGKTVDFVGKVERGARRISVEDLARVGNVLGRPLEFFMGEAKEPEVERELQRLIESAKLGPQDSAELQRLPRLRSKEAVVNLVQRLENRRFGIFRQEIFEAEREVMLDGACRSWWRRRIQVLDEELPALKLRYMRSSDVWPTSCEGFTVSLLKERCRCDRGKMRVEDIHVQTNLVFYSVRFDPPLKRGDIADICCEQFHPRAYIMVREKVEELIRDKKFIENVPKERTGISIFVPTDFLRRRITFPEGYEISDIDLDVLIWRTRLHDEYDRLRTEQCLTKMKVGSRWILELAVKQPVVGAAYHIKWKPPAEKEYQALLAQGRR